MLSEGLLILGAEESDKKQNNKGHAFSRCALENIKLPSTLKVLENSAFIDCANLKTAELSEGLEVIGACAFFRSGIESVTIPTSLREVHR